MLNSEAPTAFAAISEAPTASAAISLAPTAFAAISAAPICPETSSSKEDPLYTLRAELPVS